MTTVRDFARYSRTAVQRACAAQLLSELSGEHQCPQCISGVGELMGMLGDLEHYRCRACHWWWSGNPKANAKANVKSNNRKGAGGMTKRHFIGLADVIRGVSDDATRQRLIDRLADWCKSENPAFNRERWIGYIYGTCGPCGGRVRKHERPM